MIPSNTLEALLYTLTRQGLTEAPDFRKENPLLYPTVRLANKAEEGRIRFAENYGENHDTLEKAIQRTRQAYDDSLFRVFINGEEITTWDAPIKLCQGAEIVIIRLTMLTGLYF